MSLILNENTQAYSIHLMFIKDQPGSQCSQFLNLSCAKIPLEGGMPVVA